ncbi:hypothetical protein ACIRD2_16360 [Streptomyces sp. NPDC093595]|uniref:hypothetical protein n=1 Tax=Streptomyces sp. NPDC093595 TaxID=3366045 RepID=UPI003811AEEE
MSSRKSTTIGVLAAIFIFFLGLLIHDQVTSPSGELGQALVIFALVAVPGAFFAAWLAGAGRRKR